MSFSEKSCYGFGIRVAWRQGLSRRSNYIEKTLHLPHWICGPRESVLAAVLVREQTEFQDFDPIFAQGVVIVGGHAVNLWASYYADRGDPVLASFAPFTSKDADIFLKDRDLAMAVATAADWNFRTNPEPRSPVLGAIVMKKGTTELQVDVLRSVTGLTASDLAMTELITFANGKSYSVPAPEVMLKAKLANLATHDQAQRQDERHVRILTRCCAQYLTDVCVAVTEGALSEREAVNRFMATLRVISTAKVKKLDTKFDLRLPTAIPAWKGLEKSAGLVRLRAFYAHQIEGK